MVNGKIEAYIGFCIKSGKISLGSGAISTLRGGVYLIIADGTAAKNSKRLALKFKNRFNCPLLICGQGFENAAKAILQTNDGNYELYCGGSNF